MVGHKGMLNRGTKGSSPQFTESGNTGKQVGKEAYGMFAFTGWDIE